MRETNRNPEIPGGMPVFRGTRVPVKNLFDYLRGNSPLAEFLDDFPTVSEAQALAVLKAAEESVTSITSS